MPNKRKAKVTSLTCDGCGGKRSPLKKVGPDWYCFDCVELVKKGVEVK